MPTSWKAENVVWCQAGYKNEIPEKIYSIPSHSASNGE